MATPPTFKLSIFEATIEAPGGTSNYTITGQGFEAPDLSRIERQLRWNWLELMRMGALSPTPEGPLGSQWKTSVITTSLNGSQMDIQLLVGMADGVHMKLLGAEGTAVQT
ncbi:hypothetical protein AB1N83_009469 [Pleurotus pulmonarius]